MFKAKQLLGIPCDLLSLGYATEEEETAVKAHVCLSVGLLCLGRVSALKNHGDPRRSHLQPLSTTLGTASLDQRHSDGYLPGDEEQAAKHFTKHVLVPGQRRHRVYPLQACSEQHPAGVSETAHRDSGGIQRRGPSDHRLPFYG